jgi:hypothetical protein
VQPAPRREDADADLAAVLDDLSALLIPDARRLSREGEGDGEQQGQDERAARDGHQ